MTPRSRALGPRPSDKWFSAGATEGQATLEVGDRQLPVRVIPVANHDTDPSVSRAFLTGSAASALYARSIDRQTSHAADHHGARGYGSLPRMSVNA